jgi:hypothetical protein
MSYLEAEMDESGKAIADIRQTLLAIDQNIDRRFDAFEQRIDKRFDRGDRWFMWLLGVQIATLLAIIGGLFQIVTKLVS